MTAHQYKKDRFVIIVDRDTQSLSSLSPLLQCFHYRVITCTTGSETLETASVVLPSAIIISPELPDMNGYHLMVKLKHTAVTTHIPIVVLIKKEELIHKSDYFEAGAVGYLYQPIDLEMLYRVLQIAVEKNPRMSMRVRTQQPVIVQDRALEKRKFRTDTLDLSAHGMFLRSRTPCLIDSQIALEFNLEGRNIASEAVVVYTCGAGARPYGDPGMGIKFTRIEPGDQEHIKRFAVREIMRNIELGESVVQPPVIV
jgi:DNA-binding response OmpR family regulator